MRNAVDERELNHEVLKKTSSTQSSAMGLSIAANRLELGRNSEGTWRESGGNSLASYCMTVVAIGMKIIKVFKFGTFALSKGDDLVPEAEAVTIVAKRTKRSLSESPLLRNSSW